MAEIESGNTKLAGAASDCLRSATQSAHREVEAQINWRQHLSCRPSYVILLQRLHELSLSADAAIDRWLASEIDWIEERRRSDAALADLAVLGSAATSHHGDHYWWVNSAPAAAGLLYVVEGATLGGSVLARIVNSELGLDRETGASFLTGYGDQTMQRWSRTQAWLDEYLENERRLQQAVSAAINSFEIYGAVLQGASDE